MLLFKKLFRYVVLFSALIFVPFIFADDFDISQYISQDDMKSATQDLITVFTKQVLGDKYFNLDNIDAYQGSVSIDQGNLDSINLTSFKIEVSGVPIFNTYAPTLLMHANIAPDCTLSNEKYEVQKTNIVLDGNFKKNLNTYGHFIFESLIHKILNQHSELLNRCRINPNVDITTLVSQKNIQTATQAFADELKKSHLNLDNMMIEKINSYTGFATIENNILNHIRISSFKLDLSGFPLYNFYSPTIDIDADIPPDCSVSKHTFIVEESNPGLDNFFHMNLYNHGDTFIKTLIQSSLLKNYCSPN
jgi:hypothetical protein